MDSSPSSPSSSSESELTSLAEGFFFSCWGAMEGGFCYEEVGRDGNFFITWELSSEESEETI